MRIGIVTPIVADARSGNVVTARRWAAHLRALGHEVSCEATWDGQPWDLLVALHARRSHPAVRAFRDRHPERPIVVALTGTDVYEDLPAGNAQARDSLACADAIVTLQPRARAALPTQFAARAHTIRQSAVAPPDLPSPPADAFDVAVVGHLRPVKRPFLAARASRLLPASSRVRIVHIGAALTPDMEAQARAEADTNPRYQWLGSLPRDETLRRMAACHLLALTSRAEGGANVIVEALVCGVPVVAARIDGVLGTLGDDYPGLFDGDTPQPLAELLDRAETDAPFLADLRARGAVLRRLVAPEREREAWRDLLAQLMSSDVPPSR